ncbi:MAG: hypothetical protein AUJ49_03610 [Desulfovibrionaceae bacterium CG1_02_65_16]|nr:MAG: hypothetical protein AUJ49_03610 [Desulfovibrionaceae bacterium CG1_02_65_16]
MRVRKTLSAGVILALTAVSLGGCLPPSKDWTHPRIADPRKEDRQFQQDTQFCNDKAGRQADGPERKAAMDDCYRRLGWQHKD